MIRLGIFDGSTAVSSESTTNAPISVQAPTSKVQRDATRDRFELMGPSSPGSLPRLTLFGAALPRPQAFGRKPPHPLIATELAQNPSLHPLHQAILLDDFESVDQLTRAPTHIDALDRNGRTPLFFAAASNNIKMVQLLLERGANPYAQDRAGTTPLLVAAANNHLGVIQQMVELLKNDRSPHEGFWLTQREVSATITEVLARKLPINSELIDMLMLQLVGATAADLNSPTQVTKYLGHLRSWPGTTFDMPAESWTPDDMLQQRIRSLITIMLRQESPPPGEDANSLQEKLSREVANEAETLRQARRRFILFMQTNDVARDAVIGVEVNNILARIATMPAGDEYTIPMGFPGHCVYLSVRPGNANGQSVLSLRLDNLGAGRLGAHRIDADGRIAPLSFNVPIAFLQTAEGIQRMQALLTSLVRCSVELDTGPGDLYGVLFALSTTLKQRYGSDIIDATSGIDGKASRKRNQTVGNCTLKNHSAGMAVRLGTALFDWVKQHETQYIKDRILNEIFTEAAFEAKDQQKIASRFTEILSEDPVNKAEVLRFLGKPGRENLAADLDPELWCKAVTEGDADIIRLLLTHGANVEVADRSGATALHWAVRSDNLDVAELLLAKGANIDTADGIGRTPAHYAVLQGHEAMLDLLSARNADLTVKDREGLTPTDLAVRQAAGAQHLLIRLAHSV